MNRTVLLRRPQLHGDIARMVRATVLSQQGDTLRVVMEGTSKPIEVKASEVKDAPTVFGNLTHMQRGIVVARQWPDSPNSLSRICESRTA